jgi:hypothetical protein
MIGTSDGKAARLRFQAVIDEREEKKYLDWVIHYVGEK